MTRVIYDTVEDCTRCPYNHGRICMKLKKYLFDVCFERDCPLPTLSDVESFTRYVTRDKGLKCHGNCKHWKFWHYAKAVNGDVGRCERNGVNVASHSACDEYEEV